MTQPDLLKPLVDAIEIVKGRITEHGPSLRENEIRTRAALIDPILKALGWDVSDPDLVMPESPMGSGRVDYALRGIEGPMAVALEAKKLDESLHSHRDQMLTYANSAGVRYAGLTDGSHWELYDVFKAVPLAQKQILDIAVASPDSSAHELALRLLLLWRPNVVSRQPVGAAEPIAGIPAVNIPTAKEPQVVLNSSPSPQPSVEWTPLGEARPTKDNRPTLLKFPDDTVRKTRRWTYVSTTLIEWLYEKEKFTLDMVPLETLDGATIVASSKKTKDYGQAGTHPIYVNKKGAISTHIHRWQYIASEFGLDLNSVLVQIR